MMYHYLNLNPHHVLNLLGQLLIRDQYWDICLSPRRLPEGTIRVAKGNQDWVTKGGAAESQNVDILAQARPYIKKK